ncbi:receptor-like serine/threonine-protein kinase SD1-8 [Solanum stenotomum]|uniref:receptor-like serine/threonine-protein kinase SD1-8 n=1 Tax=Solanum stenotomum TaxID=172797 RepID=UPI0020D105A8|nr:receptor-like serine/threonine-protein kinase SD1-8 [Solanum stenotomum]
MRIRKRGRQTRELGSGLGCDSLDRWTGPFSGFAVLRWFHQEEDVGVGKKTRGWGRVKGRWAGGNIVLLLMGIWSKIGCQQWYKDVGPGTVVWVGNRRNPVNCGALLGLDTEGDIFLQDILGTTVWIHKPNSTVPLPVLKLLDSGNLVFGDSSNLTAGEYLWQSFDHPVDTLLPGMKLGWDKKTGIDRSMRSWRTEGDPALGDYLFSQERLEFETFTESRWKIQFLRWNNATNYWEEVNTLNKDTCDQYNTCGPYRVCSDRDLPCGCPDGFTAASPDEWGMMNFTEGCRRNTSLNYTNKDVFVENNGLKLPDNASYWGMLYHQEYAPVSDSRWKNEWTIFASLISELALLIILLIAVVVLCQKMRTDVLDEQEINQPTNSQGALLQGTNVIAYDFSDLVAATNNFSLANKIGHGGFDNVYKGVLENGVEIAVKKQDVTSRQGFTEFENEVKLIAKLQHRNLTKLLGYCINGTEKFLVYEFMANNSLNKVIFDPARRGTVTWPMHFNIIKGIAKGLVYMHHDSRLTIIHRDLKASNVLLDREMTPKISDLGLSRVFEDDVEEKTQHLIGTRGYMPPEYMKNGHYSTKSDVFSFGILALEIVSGQKNYDYRHPVYDIGLVDYAWRIWSMGNAIELLDPMIEKPGDENEVLGCILVGLLCCQRRAQDRPSMIQVVSLLEENEMSRLNFVPQEP